MPEHEQEAGAALPASPGSANLDLCLTCGAEVACALWGGRCEQGHEVVHQLKCDKCGRRVGVITDDDYCGPGKLVCPDCMDAARRKDNSPDGRTEVPIPAGGGNE